MPLAVRTYQRRYLWLCLAKAVWTYRDGSYGFSVPKLCEHVGDSSYGFAVPKLCGRVGDGSKGFAVPKLCTIERTGQEAAAKIGGILALCR